MFKISTCFSQVRCSSHSTQAESLTSSEVIINNMNFSLHLFSWACFQWEGIGQYLIYTFTIVLIFNI